MSELVYILTNPVIPDLVKIGRATNLEERLKDLSRPSGVPVPFECYYCCEVENASDIEKRLHFGLGDHRINPKREFFRINPERAKILLEGWAIREVILEKDVVDSQEEQDSLNRQRSIQPAFTFSMVDIPIGSKLTFLRDETRVSTVTGEREIEYEGEKGSLSKFALNILVTHFGKIGTACRGPDYWVFENETLTERRIRMETSSS
ncbi:MAG: GIY-YIG nuclease family protein [Parvularculales bacterium]